MLCMSFCEVLIILKAVGGRGEEEQASSASGLLANFATHASVSASHQGCAQKWFLQWAACFFLSPATCQISSLSCIHTYQHMIFFQLSHSVKKQHNSIAFFCIASFLA